MKNLFLICLFVLFTIPASGKVLYELPRDIELQGRLEFDSPRSLSLPVEATIDETQLSVTFPIDLDDAVLTITSTEGVVQTYALSFKQFHTTVLHINHYSKGIYTLSIITSRGTNLHGVFELK